MRQNIDVSFDNRTGQLVLDCPFHMNTIVKSLPVRRWDKRRRQWVAPPIWRNVAMIKDFDHYFSPDQDSQAVITTVLSARDQAISKRDFPADHTFKQPPFIFQAEALKRSHGVPFGFFMDMGTGKSKTLIDRMSAYFNEGLIDRVLIVCLKSARQVWPRELEKHCPLDYSVHLLKNDTQFHKWMSEKPTFPWFVVGVETFSQGSVWQTAVDFVRGGKSGFAIDEAHTVINSTSIRSKRLYEISMACPRETRSVLTGTPITSGAENFFGLFRMLDPEILGFPDFYSFESRYAIKGGYENRQIVSYQNLEELYSLIRPYMYQITKAEALPHLPPKLYERRVVDMATEQRRLYLQMKKDEFYQTDIGTMSTEVILTKMLRLQQIANGYAAVFPGGDISKKPVLNPIGKRNPKIDAVIDISREVSGGMIVWCIYRRELSDIAAALREEYGENAVVVYHGLEKGYTEDDRIAAVDSFQNDPECRFFVGTVQAGSLGLTLTFGTTVVYFANTFALNDRKQSEDRAHREGQQNAVTYIDLISAGTIDSLVLRAVKKKISIAEIVRQSLKDNPKSKLVDFNFDNSEAPF